MGNINFRITEDGTIIRSSNEANGHKHKGWIWAVVIMAIIVGSAFAIYTYNQATAVEVSVYNPGSYTCISDRAYFYNSPDLYSKKNAYIIKNQTTYIQSVQGDFGYTEFYWNGRTTRGWLNLRDLRKE